MPSQGTGSRCEADGSSANAKARKASVRALVQHTARDAGSDKTRGGGRHSPRRFTLIAHALVSGPGDVGAICAAEGDSA